MIRRCIAIWILPISAMAASARIEPVIISECNQLLANAWAQEMVESQHAIFLKLSLAELARVSQDIVVKGESEVAEFLRLREKTVSTYVNRDGAIYLKLIEPTKARALEGLTTSTYLPMDFNTGAIEASSGAGLRLIQSAVEDTEDGVSLIFIDVNGLGRVNYFRSGQFAGDQYLHAVAMAIRQNMRSSDLFFRTGGDELVLLVDITDPQLVKEITQRIVDLVTASPEARAVFHSQGKVLAAEYREVKNAKSIEQLTSVSIPDMSNEDRALAKQDFTIFQLRFMEKIIERVKEHANMRPSISIGASIVQPGVNYVEAKKIAEQQATRVKIEYKMRRGQDTSKYQGGSYKGSLERRRTKLGPEISDPVILKPLGR